MRLLCVMVSVIPEAKHGEYLPALKRTLSSLRRQDLGPHSLHIALGDDGSHYLREHATSLPRTLERHTTASIAQHHDLAVDDIFLVQHTPHYNKAALLNHYLQARLRFFDAVLLLDDDHPFTATDALTRALGHLQAGYDFVMGRLQNPDGSYRTYWDNRVQGTTLFFSRRLMEAIDYFGESVQRWGCGEDSETFWRVFTTCQRLGWRGVYDGNIMTVDELSGRWAACSKQAGGVEFFRQDFGALYGVNPHDNPSRDKRQWLDYVPMDCGLDEAWMHLLHAQDGLPAEDASFDPAALVERIALGRSRDLGRLRQRLAGKEALLREKNGNINRLNHRLRETGLEVAEATAKREQLQHHNRQIQGERDKLRKELADAKAKRELLQQRTKKLRIERDTLKADLGAVRGRLRSGFWTPGWSDSKGKLNRQVAWVVPPAATIGTRRVKKRLRALGQRAADASGFASKHLEQARDMLRRPSEMDPEGASSTPVATPVRGAHVCIAIGPWQLVALRAALDDSGIRPQDAILVLYDQRLSSAQQRRWTAMAHVLGDWRRIVWFDDLVQVPAVLHRAAASPRELLEAARQRIGPEAPECLWLPKLFHAPEKLIAEAFADSPIQVYEEGLASYLDKAVVPSAPSLREVLGTRGVYAPHLDRLQAAHFFVPSCRKPSYASHAANSVAAPSLRRVLEDLNFKHRPLITQEPKVILVGQCLGENGLMPRDLELALYLDVAKRIMDEGGVVMWREHPRTRRPFGPEITKTLGNERCTTLDAPDGIPLEAVLLREDVTGVVGAFSSTLLYAPLVGNVPTARIADLEASLSADGRSLLEIIEPHVPTFNGCASLRELGDVGQAAE